MNVVDLHPEDLIDKLESGCLGIEEKTRLEAHLRGCAECRFEISVRADLASEALAPRARAAGPLAAPRSVAPRRSLPPRRALFFAAIAAALVAGGALAAVVSEAVRARPDHPPLHRLELSRREGTHREAPSRRGPTASTEPFSGALLEARVAPNEPAAVAERAAEPVEPAREPMGSEATTTAVESGVRAAPLPHAGNEAAAGDNRAAVASVAGARPRLGASPASMRRTGKVPEPAPAEAEPRTAAGLFGSANRARRYGDTAQAIALYRSLQGRFPASEEARLSRATLATLELDRGDASAALDGFDRYLEQGGSALGVEALVGRAAALQKLGKTSEELASWKEIARRFPGTVHAKRAAARIAVLSGR